MDPIPSQSAKLMADWGHSVGIRVLELEECASWFLQTSLQGSYTFIVEAFGKANLSEPIKPTPDTIASICYTSVSNLSSFLSNREVCLPYHS